MNFSVINSRKTIQTTDNGQLSEFPFYTTENNSKSSNGSIIPTNTENKSNFIKIPAKNTQSTMKPNRIFYVKNNSIKPIFTTNFIKSGVFRSTQSTESVNSSQMSNNIVLSNARDQSRIISVDRFHTVKRINSPIDNGIDNVVECKRSKIMDRNTLNGSEVAESIDQKLDAVDVGRSESQENVDEIIVTPLHPKSSNQILTFEKNHKSAIYTNPSNKQQIIFHILKPDDLNLSCETLPTKLPIVEQPENITNSNRTDIGVQRTRRLYSNVIKKGKIDEVPIQKNPIARTRSGRLSKPPQFLQRFLSTAVAINDQQNEQIKINFPKAVACNNTIVSTRTVCPTENNSNFNSPKMKRNIPCHFICKTCNKIYLGANKVKKHLQACPGHEMKRSETTTDTQPTNDPERVFDVLLKKLQHTPKEEQIRTFLSEISDFIGTLELIRSRLICTSANSTIEYFDEKCGRAFGIEKGNYQINSDVLTEWKNGNVLLFNQTIPDDFPIEETNSLSSAQNLEYNLNLSLDSISDSKMNLAEGISEESLLQSVEDLVKERIKHLPEDVLTATAPVHFHHISDNAVEAVGMKNGVTIDGTAPVLDLSIDLFQFHSN